MKAYITKYALTKGILEREGEINDRCPTMFSVDGGWGETYHGNDWHTSRPDAVARAEQMRVAEIDRLFVKLAKLRKLRFY